MASLGFSADAVKSGISVNSEIRTSQSEANPKPEKCNDTNNLPLWYLTAEKFGSFGF